MTILNKRQQALQRLVLKRVCMSAGQSRSTKGEKPTKIAVSQFVEPDEIIKLKGGGIGYKYSDTPGQVFRQMRSNTHE